MPFYLDTSAFLELLVTEPESPAMRAWFGGGPSCWSSQLLVTEALRAARRLGVSREAVDEALDAVSLILPAATTFHRAATLEPGNLRSLDALHLAAALDLGGDLEGVVAYDRRIIEGARRLGMTVITPA